MSAPSKPWENTRFTNQQHTTPGVNGSGRNVLYSNAPQPSGHVPTMNTPVTVSQRASNLPPLPQRPQQLFNRPALGMAAPGFGGYPGYNSGYGSYGGYGASSYGGYGASSYGGYGASYGGYGASSYGGMYGVGGYGSFPVGGGYENRFLQVAEESSRDAFQSIESIVRAFTSVSMMLESTYYAMYSSFRAILGVVDNFSRLRQIFVQFLSTITILRIIRNFYRQLLHWLGVLDHSPQAERVWETVNGQAGEETTQVACSPKWPLLTFLAFLFGGPYLISKFFISSNPSENENQWDHSKGRYVRAAYPHQAGTEAELSFQANEVLNVAPREMQTLENSGWLLASNQSGQTGYVPFTRLVATTTTPVAATTTTSSATATAPGQECSDSQSGPAGRQYIQVTRMATTTKTPVVTAATAADQECSDSQSNHAQSTGSQ